MPQRRYGKFQVWVYTRDERGHRPHVHVIAGRGRAVIDIGDGIHKALEVISEHAEELLALWRQYDG